MITFGFKNKFSGIIRALCALAIGIVMIVMPDTSIELVVKVIATFLIATGVVSIIFGVMNRTNGTLTVVTMNAVVNIILGIIIFTNPAFVASIIIMLLGIALLCFGGFQLIALYSAKRYLKLPLWGYILPIITTIGGFLLVFKPFGVAEFISIVAGALLIIYALSEFLSSWNMNKAIKQEEITINAAPKTSNTSGKAEYQDIKDAEFEKVD